MKKFLPYVLILIILTAFLVPMMQVSAQGSIDPNRDPNTNELYPVQTPVSPGVLATATNTCVTVEGLGNIICRIHQLLNSILPLLLALGVVYFAWGVISYVVGDDEEAKKKGKNRIVYGIIGFAVIIGLWGLVNIVVNTFGIGGQDITLSTLSITPGSANASNRCDLGPRPNLQKLLFFGTCVLSDLVIPLIFALASVIFIWGVVQYVINSDDEAKKTKGRQFMIWGIIALTVMVCVWGLVSILGKTFGIDTGFIPQVAVPK